MALICPQRAKSGDFAAVRRSIRDTYPRAALDALIDSTVTEVRAITRGKRCAYAWSGGKDSIAIRHIAQLAGIERGMIAVSDGLEYPAFTRWLDQNLPAGCDVVRQPINLTWLAAHDSMLFPGSANVAARWFKLVQQNAQDRYFHANNLDLILLGRRRADGNYVGRNGNIYTTSRGVTRYSPLDRWSHEDVLALIEHYSYKTPPFYDWPRGYQCSTHCWPSRQYCASRDQGFAEVHEIDASIIPDAARVLPAAREWLERFA